MKNILVAAMISFLVNIVGKRFWSLNVKFYFIDPKRYKCRAVVIIMGRKTASGPIMMLLNGCETNTGTSPMIIRV